MSVKKCIINYIRKHFILSILLLIVIVLVTLLALLPPQLLAYIVDDIYKARKMNLLLIMSFVYFASFLLIKLFDFLKEVILVIISNGISKEIRLSMINKIHHLPYNYFYKLDTGELEALVNNDVESLNVLITNGVISMVIDLFKVIGIIISIFLFSVSFGITIVLFLPFVILFTFVIRKLMFNSQLNARRLEGNVNNVTLETIDTIQTIKSTKTISFFTDRYESIIKEHYKAFRKSSFFDGFFAPIMQIIKNMVIVIIICLTYKDNSLIGITTGMLVASIDLITNLFLPIENLGMEIQTIQKSLASCKRINNFFYIKTDCVILENSLNDFNKITFQKVSFSYDNEKVLSNFDLIISHGERLLIKGSSGAGKSTIFKLAYGLLLPNSGKVLINDIEVSTLDKDSRKKMFGIIYQEPFFSGGTIYDECTLLNTNITETKVSECLKIVGLDKRVSDIYSSLDPKKYSTGELALFGLVRVLIQDPQIIFIDELSSKIDAISLRIIYDILNTKFYDRTIISISHSYLDNEWYTKVIDLNDLKGDKDAL